MDMQPPQAPPAMTQGSEQEAVAAIGRLGATQDWLARQESLLPVLPGDATAEGRDAFLHALDAYWAAPVEPSPGATPIPRSAAFMQRLAATMRDDATLRRLDGTLGDEAALLALSFARSDGAPVPASVHAYELMVGNTAYAGAVVLTDDNEPHLALLFMPDRGWLAFTDRQSLHRATEQRIRTELVRGVAPAGIMGDDLHAVLDAPFVDSRALDGDAFEALGQTLLALHRDRVSAAWGGLAAAPDADATARYLADRVAPTLRLHPLLDIHAILGDRDLRLAAQLSAERLQGVPENVARAWNEARDGYALTMRIAEKRRADLGLQDIMPFDVFVHDALQTRLVALGITVDPDDIVVDVHDFTRAYFHNPSGRVDASYLGRPRKRLTLAGAVMRNAGFLDNDIFVTRHAESTGPSVDVPSGTLKTLMREADLTSAYARYLVDALDVSPKGRQARALANDVRKARMRFEAEDARLGYFHPGEPQGFRADHEFRGYEFVNAVLDAPHPSTRRRVGGHEVVVRQLLYRGEPLDGVLAIGTRTGTSVAREILYTPDAPDGIAFREFSDRRTVARDFLDNPLFEEYLLDRLPADAAQTTPNGSARHFRVPEGQRQFRWVFSLDKPGRTQAAELFDDRVVEDDLLDTAYDTSLALVLTNVRQAARTTAHADIDNLPLVIDTNALGRGIARFIGRPFEAGWRTYDRIREGDHGQAAVAFTEAYVASLDFLAVGAMKPLLARSIAARAAAGSPRVVRAGARLRNPVALFDDRFVARGVSVRDATSVRNGVYTIRGGHYIEHGGKVYGVRREGQTWRLAHPDSATYAPHVARNASGEWGYVGLQGGITPMPFPWTSLDDNSSLAALSFHQRRVFEDTLIARTGIDEARFIVARMGDDPLNTLTTQLTAEQCRHWQLALEAARSAPRTRPWIGGPAGPSRPAGDTGAGPSQQPGHAAAPLPTAVAQVHWTPPAILEEVQPALWPETLWYYPPAHQPLPSRTAEHLVLNQSRHNAAGVAGIGALAMEPRTPWLSLNAALGGPTLVPGRFPAVFEWVSINLAALRARVDVLGRPVFRVFRIRNGSNVNYLLRQVGAGGDAPTIWLRRGEFDTGVRILTMEEATP